MKRTIKFKQNQRRRQQREGWELDKSSYSRHQENVKSSCCNQQNDNAESLSIKFNEK